MSRNLSPSTSAAPLSSSSSGLTRGSTHLGPFKSTAQLRDEAAVAAAEAMRPALPVFYAGAAALFISAAVFAWLALETGARCALPV